MKGNAVVIHDGLGEYPTVLDLPNLELAIRNIEAQRSFYFAQKDFDRQLRKYQGALSFIKQHQEQAQP